MKTIKLKRVYEEYAPGDGYRVLVDRLWPRGMRKENLRYDLWAKELAPSPELRIWYHADPEARWDEFRIRYTDELAHSEYIRQFTETTESHDTLTLLFAAKDPVHNHAIILKAFLDKIYR
ncbi:MAG: DUF488 family protein [Bacteroidales bacterium]|nr:DUF488 family protein [Bacteroidales bacterium]